MIRLFTSEKSTRIPADNPARQEWVQLNKREQDLMQQISSLKMELLNVRQHIKDVVERLA